MSCSDLDGSYAVLGNTIDAGVLHARYRFQEAGLPARLALTAKRPHALLFFVKKRKAITGLREESAFTNWMLSKTYPFPVHSFTMRSSSSSVTELVSTTLYSMALIIDETADIFNRCVSRNFPVAMTGATLYNPAMPSRKKQILTGLDKVEQLWPKELRKARVGLLSHPASVNRKLDHAVNIFHGAKTFRLSALFGPQHGIYGQTQDNMVEWEGFLDPATGLPVYSLYGAARKPTKEMLQNIDVLALDLQDVGSRYYTFIWTLDLCMQACEAAGKPVVVLDRPNPISGSIVEGPVLDPAYASFVGLRPLTVRHGMTIGEIGAYLRDRFYPGLEYHIIPVQGWKRDQWFDQTGLPWVLPSPNMPTLDAALVYPGMCLFEGTNVSEGRGTTLPFEIFGAPFIHPDTLVAKLREFRLPGVLFRPLYFEPTFQKHKGLVCGGAQIHVTDRMKFRPFKTGVAILKAIHNTWPRDFAWKQPPYEYEDVKMPIDILAGTDRVRKEIEAWKDLDEMEQWWKIDVRAFEKIRKNYLIYK